MLRRCSELPGAIFFGFDEEFTFRDSPACPKYQPIKISVSVNETREINPEMELLIYGNR
jgi:hypothetical protein